MAVHVMLSGSVTGSACSESIVMSWITNAAGCCATTVTVAEVPVCVNFVVLRTVELPVGSARIVAVPGATPVTRPELLTVAAAVFELDQEYSPAKLPPRSSLHPFGLYWWVAVASMVTGESTLTGPTANSFDQ